MLIILLIMGGVLGISCMVANIAINPVKHNQLCKRLWWLCIIGVAIAILSIIAFSVINDMTYDEKVQTKRYDSISPIEHCVIGEKEMYTFFYQDGDSPIKIGNTNYPSIKICNVNAKNSTIYEQDIDAPYVIQYTVYTHNKLEGIWQDILLLGTGYAPSEKKVYEIYVPTGTAQDLQQNVQDCT